MTAREEHLDRMSHRAALAAWPTADQVAAVRRRTKENNRA